MPDNTTGLPAVIAPSAVAVTLDPAAPQLKVLEPSVFKNSPEEPSALGNTHTSLDDIESGALNPT